LLCFSVGTAQQPGSTCDVLVVPVARIALEHSLWLPSNTPRASPGCQTGIFSRQAYLLLLICPTTLLARTCEYKPYLSCLSLVSPHCRKAPVVTLSWAPFTPRVRWFVMYALNTENTAMKAKRMSNSLYDAVRISSSMMCLARI
jgi:hypothetical protein